MIEPSLLEPWIQRYEQIASRNRFLLEKFVELLSSLGRKNIEILPLKGMDLLLRGCSTLGSRPLADIDILVREKDLPPLVEYLEVNGFGRLKSGQDFLTESFADESLDYLSSELSLDIIWRVWYLDSTETLWRRTCLRSTPFGVSRLLHPEDALLYLIAYAVTRGRYHSPYFVQDLRGLIRREIFQIDWKRWCSEVRNSGMAGVVFCGLKHARRQGLQEIPEEVCAVLQPKSFSERLVDRFYSRAVKEKNMLFSYLSLFLAVPGWKKKGELLRRAFFPSASFVAFRDGEISFWTRLGVGLFRPIRILVRILYFIFRDSIKK